MKARVRNEIEPMALIYGVELTSPMGEKLLEVLAAQGVKARPVGKGEAAQQLGYLCAYPGFEKREGEASAAMETGCLVFSGIRPQGLDGLLAALRQAQVQVPLKAMVTATNQRWPFSELLVELEKERAAIAASRKNAQGK